METPDEIGLKILVLGHFEAEYIPSLLLMSKDVRDRVFALMAENPQPAFLKEIFKLDPVSDSFALALEFFLSCKKANNLDLFVAWKPPNYFDNKFLPWLRDNNEGDYSKISVRFWAFQKKIDQMWLS